MSAALITWPAVTAVPLSSKAPLAGRLSRRTLARLWAVSGSLKAKSAVPSVTGVSSGVTRLALALSGALLAPTLTVSVPLVLPPWPSLAV